MKTKRCKDNENLFSPLPVFGHLKKPIHQGIRKDVKIIDSTIMGLFQYVLKNVGRRSIEGKKKEKLNYTPPNKNLLGRGYVIEW